MGKQLYIIFFLFSLSPVLRAQDKPYVYQDSTITIPNEKPEIQVDSAVALEQDTSNSSIPEHSISRTDTAMHNNQLKLSPDSIQSWKKQKGFEYAAYLDSLLMDRQNIKQEKPNTEATSGPGWLERLLSSSGTKIFFWTLAVLFILFILYRLFLGEALFKRKPALIIAPLPSVSKPDTDTASELDQRISQAQRNGSYRLAIRYQYLKTLKLLADNHYIEMAADKTNFQYVREMTVRKYQNDFAAVTLNYEYVWYGEFQIDENLYGRIVPLFSGFNQKIQNGN